MKRTLLSLVSAAIPALALQAQYTHLENFQPGDKAVYLTGEVQQLEPGKAGKNITWNFASLTAVKDTETQVLRTAAEVYIPEGMTGCDLVECNSDSSFVYLHRSGDTLCMLGYRDAVQGFNMVYDHAVPFMVWPSQPGTTLTSIAGRSYTVNGMKFTGTGRMVMEVDGTGKLMLPGREYKKVVRVHFSQSFVDKDKQYGSETKVTTHTYTWFDMEHKHSVFKVDIMKIESAYYNQETISIKILIL